ncbi:kinase-like protein [Aureobasidium pullulans]|nr:kinase-like protein [Aureobasidium pullulans]
MSLDQLLAETKKISNHPKQPPQITKMQDISGPKHLGIISQCYDETFDSFYKFDKSLGQGGQGVVSLATVKATGKIVVIKRLILPPNTDLKTVPELVMLDRISKLGPHPNILPFLQVWNTPQSAPGECPTSRIILPYVAGGELRTLRTTFDKMSVKVPEAFIWHVYKSLVIGYGFLHDNGISHRDIKPENIMLDPVNFGDPALFPTVKIIDFGIADDVADSETTSGTPKWQPGPPECRIGGAKADVWAMGAVIHFLATGSATKTDCPPSVPDKDVHEFYRQSVPYVRRLVNPADFDYEIRNLSLTDARHLTYNSSNPLPRRDYSPIFEYHTVRALDTNPDTRITIPALTATMIEDADKQINFYKAWFRHCKAEGSQRPLLTFAMSEPYTDWQA